MSEKSYGSVPYAKVQKALDQIKASAPDKLDEIQISFEYLVGSFFPEIVKNVHDEANKQYTMGYLAGFQAGQASNYGKNNWEITTDENKKPD